MNEAEVIEILKREVGRAGSMTALAREWAVSVPYLCDLLKGRRAPGPVILRHLKLTRTKTVVYSPTR